MSSKSNPAPTISFGRDQWESVTGLPLTTADEMVSLGLIRSVKIGRRRVFLHADVEKMLAQLAERGAHLEPRKLYQQRKAERKAAGAA